MAAVETRNIARDSLFLMAQVEVEGDGASRHVKVRNLSAGGMMAEGDAPVMRGSRLIVNLRNVGSVPGSVAWTQDARFGIAFDIEIDPKLARAAQDGPTAPPAQMLKRPSVTSKYQSNDPEKLRKL